MAPRGWRKLLFGTKRAAAPLPAPRVGRKFILEVERLEAREVPTITTLNIANAEAFARVAEPVTSGVPLPQSLQLMNTPGLRILDGSGQGVPAQFRVLGRWNGGPQDAALPIKWLEVHFAANVP